MSRLTVSSWTRYKINKASFEIRYDSFFESINRNPTNPRVDAETLKWLPLLFIVVSLPTGIQIPRSPSACHSDT